jgi:hypothetical protein
MHTPEQRVALIAKIHWLPDLLEEATHGLTTTQLDFRPSPQEWSVRQIVHHVADSHMNSFVRLKLALTEDRPTIRPYDQEAFAELPDTAAAPLHLSIQLLRGLHARWTYLFEQLTEEQWARPAIHPESGDFSPDTLLATYADHGEVHLRQIAAVKRAQGIE